MPTKYTKCASFSLSSTYRMDIAFPKKNKWKQTSTNCIRIEQECSVTVCKTVYIRFILSWLGSPFSGYPIQCFFRILSLSNNESVRRTHEIWKGCVMCVCVRACLYSLCSAEIRCWKLKRNDFFFIWCDGMVGHKVEHIRHNQPEHVTNIAFERERDHMKWHWPIDF